MRDTTLDAVVEAVEVKNLDRLMNLAKLAQGGCTEQPAPVIGQPPCPEGVASGQVVNFFPFSCGLYRYSRAELEESISRWLSRPRYMYAAYKVDFALTRALLDASYGLIFAVDPVTGPAPVWLISEDGNIVGIDGCGTPQETAAAAVDFVFAPVLPTQALSLAEQLKAFLSFEAARWLENLQIATGDRAACDACDQTASFGDYIRGIIEQCGKVLPESRVNSRGYDAAIHGHLVDALARVCSMSHQAVADLGQPKETAAWVERANEMENALAAVQ